MSALKAEEFFTIGTTAAITGTVASQGVLAFAGLVGTASTGTAISTLSGAAATNATLAWLGGGSLAAGGGGMVIGSLILGSITLGSALMIGGFMIDGKGEEALIKAQKYETEVNQAIVQIKLARNFLQQLCQRLTDLSNLVRRLENRVKKILDQLESQPFTQDKQKKLLKSAAVLVKTLDKIQKTPVLDKKGNLNPDTEKLFHPNLVQQVQKEQKTINFVQKTGIVLGILLLINFGVYIVLDKFVQKPNVNELNLKQERQTER
ncbi:hypothetical protein IQ238_26425 [Pleurocapsales cyanobacterium LEGE 06147]|nr:hypothetical protein [Pleurocapsales cyanobacterium LEGE 06147]